MTVLDVGYQNHSWIRTSTNDIIKSIENNKLKNN